MKTIALRFGESFAPQCGTIAAHQEIIDKNGFVWYGKIGAKVSHDIIEEIRIVHLVICFTIAFSPA